ncbi:hypothetical protein KP509_08G063500 [Ceratopteris richardii]|uniref:SAC3/GANP/THP3 conserved domain-containing protein n=1 Tax=Ceratopteris richardii TaxID=49495 RepID=A0A8T2UH35_CERRI|nr:hypothetical protein KP509_08G063500 [Ceratopteris richardii]
MDDLSKPPANRLVREENQKPTRASGQVPMSYVSTFSKPQNNHSTSGFREPRTKHISPQNSALRPLASDFEHPKSAGESSPVLSLSAEKQRDEIARGRRLRRFNDLTAKGAIPVSHSESEGAFVHVTNMMESGPSKIDPMNTKGVMKDSTMETETTDVIVERDWQSTEPILGNCPDMCPESERLERERKGDLDKLERLDGDRNQTSRDLAVKKYTRTAEKHASLIRPISVLLRTMKHLLHLLNRSYDEELINLHNFLWDRMRAVRMDLRMQHIFNQDAVLMHEQMIRFHILAMHELCEYAKGAGFSEGFDAHLNIEQMNKASVDLFHMYDDLRKSGMQCSCEPEFRGYYALLKLDKHPGYVVEPAELSLDLAKMTPEMRNTKEVQFARKVARACRFGNYLTFFRLARDATYLQACLMHAHFSKLRSQAMASLYSGLQRNQGIPVVQVEDWLGMEGEDIEALIEYHGFAIKTFEEPYMVKEGPLLNQSQPFRTRRSKLVEEKRSRVVKYDVLSSGLEKTHVAPMLERISSLRRQSELQYPTQPPVVDEEMPDYEEEEQLQESSHDQTAVFPFSPIIDIPQKREPEIQTHVAPLLLPDLSMKKSLQGHSIVRKLDQDHYTEWSHVNKRRKSSSPRVKSLESHPVLEENASFSRDKKVCTLQDSTFASTRSKVAEAAETSAPFINMDYNKEELRRQEAQRAEDLDRICISLRKWRAIAAFLYEERQWRQQKRESALNSFFMGLPFENEAKDTQTKSLPANMIELDIIKTEEARFMKIERMWSKLDVIGLVHPILKEKNPVCKFLCWKLLMCSHAHEPIIMDQGKQGNSADWLLTKISHQMPVRDNANGRTLHTEKYLANVFFANEDSEVQTPFFYIARELQFQGDEIQNPDAGRGASGIIFLVSESAPLAEECRRLHALVNSLQCDVHLPLLVLYSSSQDSVCLDPATLVKGLEMGRLNKGKVACWKALSILEDSEPSNSDHASLAQAEGACGEKSKGYYSDDVLKHGLSWLAQETHMPPNLRCVNILDLVMEHLWSSSKTLLAKEPVLVTPNMCVEAFNEALLKAANDVNSAAHQCGFGWPPSELTMLFDDSTEKILEFIPKTGWNEASYVLFIIEALSLCQLPQYPLLDVTFKHLGDKLTLKRQKAALESDLHMYMNQICGLKDADLLTLQLVNGMIQKGCTFKLTDKGRLLLPNWPLIFQQIYHCRLALLSSDPPTIVWVQTKTDFYVDIQNIGNLPATIGYRGPTLDEMIELEHQEFLLQRNLAAVSLSTNQDVQTARGSQKQLSSLIVAELEELRRTDSEVLKRSVSVEQILPEITDTILLPTKEELELEKLVSKLCERMDQAADAANFRGIKASTTNWDNSSANDIIRSVTGNDSKVNTTSNVPAAVSASDAHPHKNLHHYLMCGTGMDSLTSVLKRCENVQSEIDETLEKVFRE